MCRMDRVRESFGPDHDRLRDDWVSMQELRAVLQVLDADADAPAVQDVPDDHVSIEAIAEATGLTIRAVELALEEVRRCDQEAELARRIRELEEPLYRVERPGHPPPDPVARTIGSRRQMFSTLLDDLPKVGERPHRKMKREDTAQERLAGRVANIVLVAFLTVFVALCSWGLFSALLGGR